MNAHSSRAHAVLSIAVHKATIPGTAEDDPVNISARMNLVDLAGSERQASTGATGAQLKEGGSSGLTGSSAFNLGSFSR